MPTCQDIDNRLVDWLYHELDPATLASFREHIDACESCAAQIASFAFIREMMRALPAEEPPLACSNIILHEASKRGAGAQASSERESTGIWAFIERLIRPVTAHPAVAAVASLLLIVTIGGALYLRGGRGLTEPVVTDTRTAFPVTPERPAPAAGKLAAKDTAGQMPDDESYDRARGESDSGRVADLIDAEDQGKLRESGNTRPDNKPAGYKSADYAGEAEGLAGDAPVADEFILAGW